MLLMDIEHSNLVAMKVVPSETLLASKQYHYFQIDYINYFIGDEVPSTSPNNVWNSTSD